MALAGKQTRNALLTYIDVTPGASSPTWALLGPGITDGSISYNPQTEEETYIHESSAATEVTGYQPTMSLTAQAYPGDEAFDFLDGLRMKRALLAAAGTQIVHVYLYMDSPNAELQPVSIQFDDFGGAGGESLSFGYTINYKGDPTIGDWDAANREFTAVTRLAGTTGLASPASAKVSEKLK